VKSAASVVVPGSTNEKTYSVPWLITTLPSTQSPVSALKTVTPDAQTDVRTPLPRHV